MYLLGDGRLTGNLHLLVKNISVSRRDFVSSEVCCVTQVAVTDAAIVVLIAELVCT